MYIYYRSDVTSLINLISNTTLVLTFPREQ